MHELTVWYDKRVPQEIRSALGPIIEGLGHVLPTWCQEVAVHFDPEGPTAATMGADKPYRIAHLTVSGGWLRADLEERVDIVRHEFVHVALSVMTNWVKDVIPRLVSDDERFREWLLSEWQDRLEGATCDLELALRRAPGEAQTRLE